MLGPGALTVVGVDSMWVTAVSVALMGAMVFVVGALSMLAVRRLPGW